MLNKGFKQNMSKKGNCFGGAIIENFFRITKIWTVLQTQIFKFRCSKAKIRNHIKYYNGVRIKSNLNKMSPI
jgi:putative transposase